MSFLINHACLLGGKKEGKKGERKEEIELLILERCLKFKNETLSRQNSIIAMEEKCKIAKI